MDVKEIIKKVKEYLLNKKEQFKELKKEKKIAIVVGTVAVLLAIVFGVKYIMDSKYQVLFSGLDSNDAAAITKELENQKVDMKIKGDSIYVPKDDVDKLRLELSSSISNGSKGFEIMDEGSSFGLTDEEFEIKKQRMIQGEIEKTIKTFPQVEDARVHITKGETSVFAKESTPGTAAVYLNLKAGSNLDASQIRSIMSLVSASTSNLPKQNVEVVDQNMNLLSDGLFDENGNASTSSSNGITAAIKAEQELGKSLERSITSLLEPIFGEGKVKASVNADLNFDTSEKTEIVINPEKVITSESRSENKSTEQGNTGGAVDNNMNNTGNTQAGVTESKDEKLEYEVGKTETKTIKAQGEVNRITASVAVDGKLNAATIKDIENMVANTIGMDENRGDNISVVAMEFGMVDGMNANAEEDGVMKVIKTTAYIVGALLLLLIIALIIIFIKKKKESSMIDEEDIEASEIELINKKLEEMEQDRLNSVEEKEENVTLEEEVKKYASENPDKVTELINSWLND